MKTHTTRGFSTIEMLIAFAVGIIFLSAAMMVAFSDPSLTQQVSFENGQTAALDTVLDNYGLATSTNKVGNVIASLTKNWNTAIVTNFEIINANLIYANTPSVVNISQCMKQITNTTTWTAPNNRPRNIVFGTGLSNINIAQAYGPGGCDPLPPLDAWDDPEKYPNSTAFPIVNTNDLLVLTHGGKRIIVLGTTPTTSNPTTDAYEDIYTYDVSNPANPSGVLGKLNTGKGLNAIASDGEYVYGLQNASSNQLQVIRLFDTSKSSTDPSYYTPALITQASLQGVSGSFPEGRSIAYYDKHLYIGTWNNNIPSNSPEFLVYNIAIPSNPTFEGKIDVRHSVNSIAVQWPYAYLATTNDDGEMIIVNISTSTNPHIIASSSISTANSNVDAEEIVVLGNHAYVGMDRNSGSRGELVVVNITNPLSPSISRNLNLGLVSGNKVTGLAIQGDFLFVGTNQTNKEFRVLNVKNQANPITLPSSPYSYGEKISALRYSQGLVFASNHASTSFRVIYDTE